MRRLALKEDRRTAGGRVLNNSSKFFDEDCRPFALDRIWRRVAIAKGYGRFSAPHVIGWIRAAQR
jgi:hypothetical protein